MRTYFLPLMLCLAGAGLLRAEPQPYVYARAVDDDEILIVTGKLQAVKKPAAEPSGKPDPFAGIEVELVTERVLFGAPPPKTIRLAKPWHHEDRLQKFGREAHIYVLATSGNPSLYDLDDPWEDVYSISELKAFESLAKAHLDCLVLGSRQVFVGQAAENEVVVERVLYGNVRVNDRVRVSEPRRPVPHQQDGTYVYFMAAEDDDPFDDDDRGQLKVHTRWPTSTIPQIVASLARRDQYPITQGKRRGDEEGPVQQILFLGPRAEAFELMQSTVEDAALLGRERLLRDGKEALPEVIAAIEANLFREKADAANAFIHQRELIALAAGMNLPEARSELIRLIDKMLAAAEGGAAFPIPPEKPAKEDPFGTEGPTKLPPFLRARLASNRYRSIDPRHNHSLYWLVRTLPDTEAATKYGRRLMKLRDLAQYGWKDEAERILFAGHLDDHLEYAEVEAKSRAIQPVVAQAGLRRGHFYHAKLAFSPGGDLLAAADMHDCRVWKTSDWSMVADLPVKDADCIAFSPDGKWLIVGGYYSLQAWDWTTGEVARTYRPDSVDSLAVAGNLVYATHEQYKPPFIHAFLWDLAKGTSVQEFPNEAWDKVRLSSDGENLLGKHPRGEGWQQGATRAKERKKLPFEALDMTWTGDGQRFWTLEKSRQPAKQTPRKKSDGLPEPVGDPFGEDFAPPGTPRVVMASILRQRKASGDFAVVYEKQLDFPASEIHVAGDRKSVVVRGGEQIETFTVADWKSLGKWQIPIYKRSSFDEKRILDCKLSPDGRWLAVSRDYSYPALHDARTGELLSLGEGHSVPIVELKFANGDREIVTSAVDNAICGTVCRWDAATGERLGRKLSQIKLPEKDDFRHEQYLFTAEDGQVWFFFGDRHGGYKHPSTVFDIRLLPPGSKIDDRIDRDEPPGKSLGEIAPDSDAYESRGLVAGGKYLHFGTSIYRRTDLRLMSFVNHSGDFDRMLFSPDGERYALVTSTYDHSANRYRVRLRLHDCASGRLLFARAVDDKINDLAFSSDGKRLATVDEGAEMCVWAVP